MKESKDEPLLQDTAGIILQNSQQTDRVVLSGRHKQADWRTENSPLL